MPARSAILRADDIALSDARSAGPAGGLDDSPLPAMLVDPEGVIAESNAAANALVSGGEALIADFLADGARAPRTRARLELPGGPGGAEGRVLELALLPWALPGWRLLLLTDVTLEVNLRAALADSRQRYKDLVDASSDFAWETGPDGAFVFVSAGGALGYGADELVGRQPAEFLIGPGDAGPQLPFAGQAPLQGYEFWFRDALDNPACLVASCLPLFDDLGRWRGARGVCHDVTALRAREAELAAARNRERLMAYVLKTINDVVDPGALLETAAAATARAVDAAACLIHRGPEPGAPKARFGDAPDDEPPAASADGLPAEHATDVGSWISVATRHGGAVNGALRAWRPAAAEPWSSQDLDFLTDIAGHIAVVIEQAAQHEALDRLSRTDGLTGLDNRRAFFEAIERRLGGRETGGRALDAQPAALVYVDLDNFKQVNDAAGHQQGDEALRAVAAILRRSTRAGDRVARLGGDEFALWLDATDAAGAEAKAAALLEAATELAAFSPPGTPPLGFSLGIAVHAPASGEDLAELIARADAAMYEAKRAGKGAARLAPAAAERP